MDGYTSDEISQALPPIASLMSKSQKAQLKLAPGTWQHSMLQDNLTALRIASALLDATPGDAPAPTCDELRATLGTFDSMIGRVEGVKTKFAEGTSQHTLQRNRLKALRIAQAAVRAELAKP